MRCCCCNKNLSNYESTLKSASTGDYLDMCRKCLDGLNIKTLKNNHEPDEAPPSDENYWDFEEVELNPFIVDEE